MGNVTHSYHRLVQWTLAYLAAMVAHYGHIGIGRFVDYGKRGGGTHQVCSQVYKNTVARGGLVESPHKSLSKLGACHCLTISEDISEPQMPFL